MMVHSAAPLALGAFLGRRPGAADGVEEAWAVFASGLRPPYETQACLASALEALARLCPAQAYFAYAADAPGNPLTLRVTRAPSGQPVVGPDYSGLVSGAFLHPVPLDIPAVQAERAGLEGAAGEPFLTLGVTDRVALRAALSPAQRRPAERLLRACSLLAARLRPALELALYRPSSQPASAAGSVSDDATLLALPPGRTLDLICRTGAEALGATEGYLALWRASAPEVLSLSWSLGDVEGLLGACPPELLRPCLSPPRIAGWHLPTLPGTLAERGYSGFVCIPVREGEGGFGALALAQTQTPLAPHSVAGRLARVITAVLGERERAEHLAQGRLETLLGISDLLESCDAHLAGHSAKVARAAEAIAREMGLTPTERDAARLAGRLHDLGMVGVGLELPLRRGALTDAERQRARQHAAIGADLLRTLPAGVVPAEVVLAVLHHHEQWNGRGYPDGLAGEAIPELARILACAEVMVAKMSARSYRGAMDPTTALRFLEEASGTEFDPRVAAAARRVFAGGLV